MGETYEEAGVSITAGEEAVERIKAKVRSTFRPEVIGDIGGVGGVVGFGWTPGPKPGVGLSPDRGGPKGAIAQAAGRGLTLCGDPGAPGGHDNALPGAPPAAF